VRPKGRCWPASEDRFVAWVLRAARAAKRGGALDKRLQEIPVAAGGADIRIRIHSGSRSQLYFEQPPMLAGGQRGSYIFERRIAIGSFLPAHTFDEHIFLLPVGQNAVPYKSMLNGRCIRGYIEPYRFRFLSAGDSLSTSWSAPMDSILITIHPNVLQRMLQMDPDHPHPELVSRIAAHEDPVLMHMTLALQAYLSSGGLAGRLFENSLLSSIAAKLLFSYGNGRRSTANRTLLPRWKRTRIEDYVQANLGGSFTLGNVAAIVEMSSYQLCRTFRTTTGQTFWQYVLERRVHAAMGRIAARPALPLSQVAHDCGFESYSQFIAAFRKFTGCRPSEFRRTLGR
jgi:AraC family transcriptional regulator